MKRSASKRRHYADEITNMTVEPPNDRSVGLSLWTVGTVTVVLGLLAALCLPFQLLFGASALILMLTYATIGFGLAAFVIAGWNSPGAWLILFYLIGNCLVAVYAKTAFGQSLDSHLYVPALSFLVLLVATICMVFAAILANGLPVGRPMLKPLTDPAQLRWISWACFGLGVLGWIAHQQAMRPDGSGFGGFAFLRDFLLMAVIARTASVISSSDGRRSVDSMLFMILGTGLLVGLLTNSKAAAALPFVSYYATLMFYRYRIRPSLILTPLLLVAVLVYVVGPVIHAWRHSGFQRLPLIERVDYTIDNLNIVIKNDFLKTTDQQAQVIFGNLYYDYFKSASSQMYLGRFASVQQIDPVVMSASAAERLGYQAILPSVTMHIPRVLYPDKVDYPPAFDILLKYGWIDPEGGKFPTLPIAGQAYAAFGLLGVAMICFGATFTLLLVWKKLSGGLSRNVFSIFFFCQFIVVYASQGSLGQYVGAALRYFPVFAVIFWLMMFGRNLALGFWRRSDVSTVAGR